MSAPSTDILIKTFIEASLADLRKNEWILQDIFADVSSDPLSKALYGDKEVRRAIEWFKTVNIPVIHTLRVGDDPTFPCITVVSNSISEQQERASLADYGEEEEDFDPRKANKVPQRVYDTFTPLSYDPTTGIMEMGQGMKTSAIIPGQFLVSKSGKAYQITECIDDVSFKTTANIKDDLSFVYVVPPTALWNLSRELTYLRENVEIGCWAQSDPMQTMWLTCIMIYCIGRYKEAFLENRGFELSTFSVGALTQANEMQPENVYFRLIQLSGTIKMDWIKYVAPKLQSVQQGITIIDGPKTPTIYQDQVKKQAWDMQGDHEGEDE
jgi:hypothetical protein